MYSIMLRNGGLRELVWNDTLEATFEDDSQLIFYLLDELSDAKQECIDNNDKIYYLENEVDRLENDIENLEDCCE